MSNFLEAAGVGLFVFFLSYFGLGFVEKLIHRLTKNPDQSYRLGVWVFAILFALYGFATSLGR